MKKDTSVVKHKIYPLSIILFVFAAVLIWKSGSPVESATQKDDTLEIENYDIRTDKSDAARTAVEKFVGESGRNAAQIYAEKSSNRRAVEELKTSKRWTIEVNEITRMPEIIAAEIAPEQKFLSAPDAAAAKRPETLRRFLKENRAIFGLDETQVKELETVADYSNPDGVLSFVHLEQKMGGVPVFGGEIKAGFTKRGEMFRVVSNLAPGLDYQNQRADFGSAETAVVKAAKHIGFTEIESSLRRVSKASNDLKITFERGRFADATIAEEIYFPVEYGAARPAWRVLLWTETAAFYVIVDARDGTLLWRKNITERQMLPATFNVYGNTTSMMKTADSPSAFTPGCESPTNCPQPPAISRQTFILVGNEAPYTFNNLGWIPDTGLPVRTPADPNVTDGNNIEAGLDLIAPNGVDAPLPGDPFRVFNFQYNPFPGNPPPGEDPTLPEYRKGSVTQLFYTVNRWHDEMYLLGFTEQARNFQHFNFGRGGGEGDRISAEVQDSSGTNNVNFSSPADGGRPRLQTFILTGTTPNRDGALETQTVVHELTHGVSTRLHGNGAGLGSNMARGMGEGWSDFYALALLSEPSDNLCGKYPVGSYFILGATPPDYPAYYYGIRRFPTARINCLGPNGKPHSPLTFRHLNANCNTDINTVGAYPRGALGVSTCDQIHNLSEIWSAALWEVRGVLIDQHGAVEGNRRALQYVTDAMKLSPINPNFLQGRDAIIAAAAFSDQSDAPRVREGFRRRGMGFNASIQNVGNGTNNTVVTEAFDLPNFQIINPFTVSDAPGDNDGFPESGEEVILNVTITNQTGETLTGVFLNADGRPNVNVGTLSSGQTVQVPIPYRIPCVVVCGGLFSVTINGGSSAGNITPVIKQFRVGVPVGGPSVEFTNSAPIDMPAGQPTNSVGTFNPYPSGISVSGLSEPKTLKVRLNGFHHEFEDDIDLMLVGPGGQKYILMSDVGGNTDQSSPITFTIADSGENLLPDESAILNGETYKPSNIGANDPFAAPAPAAPYENAAPSGSATLASVFGTNGANLNGNWSLYGVDDAGGDPGRIDAGWTLIFESDIIACPTLVNKPRADFDGDGKTDLSVFRPAEGNWYVQRSSRGFATINWGLAGDVLVPGDYDGDNVEDPAIMRGGDWYILRSCDNTTSIVNWGLATDVPVPGDYDGDRKNDFAVFRPSEAKWYVLRSADGGNVILKWGISTDIPITGDFDGDGRDDFTVYRDGAWYINASASGVKIITFGLSTDLPVQADYDGDVKDDIAVFRPSNGVWYILRSTNSAVDYVQFGLNGDIPVPGDYDGDGRYDQAVYRGGAWYLNRSSSGFAGALFGLESDIPVPNSYIP